ncbi:hypothetical protein chiPu_0027845 [Chiloscyllium punctatum]|uniref:Uncharacterized protein n=1 Tax=Chiloscyllium punctatum TaxID=137246 RepID=A0A401TM77_CHIPU|nr:hypothetical protein [Chiloscyllium punctatum]
MPAVKSRRKGGGDRDRESGEGWNIVAEGGPGPAVSQTGLQPRQGPAPSRSSHRMMRQADIYREAAPSHGLRRPQVRSRALTRKHNNPLPPAQPHTQTAGRLTDTVTIHSVSTGAGGISPEHQPSPPPHNNLPVTFRYYNREVQHLHILQ